MTDWTLLSRFIHLASFAVFVGSVLTVLVVKLMADLQPNTRASVLKALIRTDVLVTAPSSILLVVTGISSTLLLNLPLSTKWVVMLAALWVIGLFIAHLFAIPQLKTLAKTAEQGDAIAYTSTSKKWLLTNIVLISILVISTAVAIWKPL